MSLFDRIFRRIIQRKIFANGWGNPQNLKRLLEFHKVLSDRDQCRNLVDHEYPVTIDKVYEKGGIKILDGHFVSPFATLMPGMMPNEVVNARFQVVMPSTNCPLSQPVCVHLAGTGDHYFWRRRKFLAKPLLRDYGISSVILENPYYGCRKPAMQKRSCLQNVADLFIMGGSLILESLALFHWIERQGWGPMGISGVSLGGHMASLAATNWHKPISLVPCLSWSTASCVFTKGVMSESVPWDVLQAQYTNDDIYDKDLKHRCSSPNKMTYNTPISSDSQQNLSNSSPNYLKNCSKHSSSIINDDTKKDSPDKSSSDAVATPDSDKPQTMNRVTDRDFESSSQNEVLKPDSTKKSFWLNTDNPTLNNLWKQGYEASDFMQKIMDEFTHLTNFSVPVDPQLVIVVVAMSDAYVPRDGIFGLDRLWPGAEIRYVNSGHVGSFLFQQTAFRKAIFDSFTKQSKMYA